MVTTWPIGLVPDFALTHGTKLGMTEATVGLLTYLEEVVVCTVLQFTGCHDVVIESPEVLHLDGRGWERGREEERELLPLASSSCMPLVGS